MRGNCLCGAVSVSIDARPEFINDCNCSLCRKSGAAWGYFAFASATATGTTVDGVEVRFPNGRDWPGEGPDGYRRAAMTIGDGASW